LHFAAWIAGSVEAGIAQAFMGHPLSFGDILVIESLIFAIRTVAFIVPRAAGVQEGGYVALGALFGLGPDVALGLSLLKRARTSDGGAVPAHLAGSRNASPIAAPAEGALAARTSALVRRLVNL
jgi:hypothetical protein